MHANEKLYSSLVEIKKICDSKKLKLGTAESCTGGNISAQITSISGASSFFQGSIISYSNELKINLLKVKPKTLENFGAVSKEVVIEMATNACKILNTDIVIAVSGIAGPTGGTPSKPVGTVHLAIKYTDKEVFHYPLKLDGNRVEIINKTTQISTDELLKILKN